MSTMALERCSIYIANTAKTEQELQRQIAGTLRIIVKILGEAGFDMQQSQNIIVVKARQETVKRLLQDLVNSNKIVVINKVINSVK